ncbi:MAG: hypothetical protein ACMUJM_23695 [bacterium]
MKRERKNILDTIFRLIFILCILIIIGGMANQAIEKYRIKSHECKCKHMCQNNLANIVSCEEAYYDRCGIYLECKPYPEDIYAGLKLSQWNANKAGNFSVIGFAPKNPVYCQYMVKVNDDGQRFTVLAIGYCDKDNTLHTYSITKDKNLLNRKDHASLPIKNEVPFSKFR